MAQTQTKKLGVIALAAIVVSAMVGGGIFSLPQNMAEGAAVMPVVIAWIITGVGIYFLANTFRILAEARPDATTGIYAYARLGFGKFSGFQIAWAYWLCNIFGNVGYAVLLMDSLDYFFPGTFAGGNNWESIIGGSLVIWIMNFLVLRGVQQASFVNIIGTVFKLAPILFFVIALVFAFRWSYFSTDIWGQETIPADGIKPLGSVMTQVKSTMMVTLWAFLGIEGAVVVSGQAKDQKSVGKATMLGFFSCLIVFALLSILPFGIMYQPDLARLGNPSTAPVLDVVVGHWGGVLMNVGVIIALLTSWLAFTIMIAQIPRAAALDGTFPRIFKSENRNGTPDVSLWVTSALMQAGMILVFFANDAWVTMLSVTAVMALPPYLACTAYLWKICATRQYPKGMTVKLWFASVCGVAGTVYAIWMIYAAGLKYMLAAFIFLTLGIPFYIWACRNDNEDARKAGKPEQPYFNLYERIGAGVVITVALVAVVLFASGKIKL